jgi:two-component system CheB/CheR fusion protein
MVSSDSDDRARKPDGDAQVDPSPAPEQPALEEAALDEVAPKEHPFPIVGIGASAGGLKALEAFFGNVPSASGIAYVVIQHRVPHGESLLPGLIGRTTSMPVTTVKDDTLIEPDHVYVLALEHELALIDGRLYLVEPTEPRYERLPIDYFFRSLAEDWDGSAIGVILSGTGTDGTLGVKAIKGEGGMAMAQALETAEHGGMPSSAIDTGLVDFILPPNEMPAALMDYIHHDHFPGSPAPSAAPTVEQQLEKIYTVIQARTGHDFSQYKENTVLRRVQRRMVVNQIEDIEDYVDHLKKERGEADRLFRELLIGVTRFFRDPEAFEALEHEVIPRLFNGDPAPHPIRVWVPGCSTGEEAYSIAILLAEEMQRREEKAVVQIFATDIDRDAIESARAGHFPANIVQDVSPERLKRFFIKDGDRYQIRQTIRDMLIFAVQSVVKDPPFSRLDLISCRNLLIYLASDLQKRVLPLFHYALRSGGYLFLGTSETLAGLEDYFEPLSRKWKIFKHNGKRSGQESRLPMVTFPAIHSRPGGPAQALSEKPNSMADLAHELLLAKLTPPCVIVTPDGEVLYFHRRTGKYLEPPSGEANLTLVGMARPGLELPLLTAIRKAQAEDREIVYTNVAVQTDCGEELINLTVRPLKEPPKMNGLLLVVFEDAGLLEQAERKDAVAEASNVQTERIENLERELQATREYLQTTTEELETSNEELKSTNEELQSANEELQSTNEELETAKEELQSVNEELVTVNNELEAKIDQLTHANNDMQNLLSSIQTAVIFLDSNLRIKRFNAAATGIVNLIESDIGRPLRHLVSNLEVGDLAGDAREVLATLSTKEKLVAIEDGERYVMRIQPYRTTSDVIDGVIITFVELYSPSEGEMSPTG